MGIAAASAFVCNAKKGRDLWDGNSIGQNFRKFLRNGKRIAITQDSST